jgi:hypothetical protein
VGSWGVYDICSIRQEREIILTNDILVIHSEPFRMFFVRRSFTARRRRKPSLLKYRYSPFWFFIHLLMFFALKSGCYDYFGVLIILFGVLICTFFKQQRY